MEPVKIGQLLFCDNCGVEMKVTKACDTICPSCKPTCCGKPLKLKSEGASANTGACTTNTGKCS